MKSEYLTRDQVLEKLEAERGGDTLAVFSKRIDISETFLCNVLNGKRRPSDKVLEFLSRNDRRNVLSEVEAYQFVLRKGK